MKKLLTLAVVVIVALAAHAQNQSPGAFGCRQDCACSNSSYNRIYVSYTPVESSYIEDGHCLSESLHGVAVGYLHGIKLTRTEPLFLEIGGRVQYNAGNYADSESTKLLSFSTPVNVAYMFSLGKNFTIVPYAGFAIKVNVLGKDKIGDETIDHFDAEDANRLQAGFQMGCGLNYKQFHVGLGCQCDITNYIKDTTNSGLVVTLGYNL